MGHPCETFLKSNETNIALQLVFVKLILAKSGLLVNVGVKIVQYFTNVFKFQLHVGNLL